MQLLSVKVFCQGVATISYVRKNILGPYAGDIIFLWSKFVLNARLLML